MIRKRLITLLTFHDGVLCRTKRFVPDYRYTLNFVDAWSVDEIIVLDVTRPGQGRRENFYRVVRGFAERCFVPLAAGGGIRDLEEVRRLMENGADKVVINTQAFQTPGLIEETARFVGTQSVVVSIDAMYKDDGSYEVHIDQGRTPTGTSPEEWARRAEARGAGEILITSIERDGSLEGYDNRLNRTVSSAVQIPVLVAGGAGRWDHFVAGFREGGADGVCTTCIYHFTETSIRSAKRHLAEAGIPVRLS